MLVFIDGRAFPVFCSTSHNQVKGWSWPAGRGKRKTGRRMGRAADSAKPMMHRTVAKPTTSRWVRISLTLPSRGATFCPHQASTKSAVSTYAGTICHRGPSLSSCTMARASGMRTMLPFQRMVRSRGTANTRNERRLAHNTRISTGLMLCSLMVAQFPMSDLSSHRNHS